MAEVSQWAVRVTFKANSLSEDQLRQQFAPFGAVNLIFFMTEPEKTERSAFVYFKTQQEAQTAQNEMNGNVVEGFVLEVVLVHIPLSLLPHHPLSIKLKQQNMIEMQIIIETEQLTDQEKEIKIKEIFEQLMKKDKNEIQHIFDNDTFGFFRSQIQDCSSGIERMLLDILEFIAEKGINQSRNNSFFSQFYNSGLFKKIRTIIEQKVWMKDKENKEGDQSNIIEQLIMICLQMIIEEHHFTPYIKQYEQILDKNLTEFLRSLKCIEQQKLKDNESGIYNEEFEKYLIRTASTIREIGQIRNNGEECLYQINKLIKLRIYPLIHINCPKELKCPYCITVPNSKGIQQLKSAIFYSITDVSENNHDFSNCLVTDHNINHHISLPIITLINSNQLKKKIKENKQQSESQYSPQFIISSLYLLHSLIRPSICASITIIPNLLISLIKLMNFNLITYFNQAYDIQAPEIRKISRMCLFKIQSNGDETVQKQLSQLGYLISLTSVIYAAGGSGKVDNDQEINLIIINIFEFFKQLYFGTNNGDTQFPPHPSLAKLSYEQLEEEGCLEEIEALIINKGVDNIKFCTNGAKQTISNIFVNKSNPSPY